MHNHNNKRITAAILALLLSVFLVFDTGTVFAKKSLDELQDEIQQKQEELNKGLKKEENLSSQVNSLEQKIYQLNDRIGIAETDLKKLKKELEEAQKKVDKQNAELGGRLRNMYKNGNVGFMDVLMNSNSFSEFLTNLDLVEKIYAGDKDVLENLQAAHDEIEKKKNKVEKLTKELNASRALAKEEMAEVEKQKKVIAADNEKNAAMLDDLENEAASVAAQLAAQSSSGEISNSSTSDYKGGVFLWPSATSRTISSEYGWRICPFHGREFHGGLDIAAGYGTSVLASASGTVISAGWNGGFGYSVRIDHGGGLVTMYNHCSSLLVSTGQRVSRGQTIAKVGSTGSSTGPHIDYRVFKNGSTVNPHNYL
ncbi:MAG: peptidoglycan DD-metalloendopeptidase family protein [Bacillota bacterium]|nr:peptidoglycan DD-metalloendopeptidase family protein [Bacillota bacterium]